MGLITWMLGFFHASMLLLPDHWWSHEPFSDAKRLALPKRLWRPCSSARTESSKGTHLLGPANICELCEPEVSSNHSIIYAHITYCNNAGLIACKPSSLRPVLLYWWVLPRSLTIWGCWEQNNHHSTYGRVSTVSIVIGVLISSRLQYAMITSFKLIVRLAIANRQVLNFYFTKQTESRSIEKNTASGTSQRKKRVSHLQGIND